MHAMARGLRQRRFAAPQQRVARASQPPLRRSDFAGTLTTRAVHIGRQSSCRSEAERRFNEAVVAATLHCVAVAVAHAEDLNGRGGNDDGSRGDSPVQTDLERPSTGSPVGGATPRRYPRRRRPISPRCRHAPR